ncbi:MAG: hypothetical protein WDZ93_02680 [Candidatus Paceibacterota bacterium]
MATQPKNGAFEAFRSQVGDVPFSITNARFEHKPDGDGLVRDWLVLEAQPNTGGVITATVRIELAAVIALASFGIGEKAQHTGKNASAGFKQFTDELFAAARDIGDRVPGAAEAGWKALTDELLGGTRQRKA